MKNNKKSMDRRLSRFVIALSLLNAVALFVIGIRLDLDCGIYMYRTASILTGVLLFQILSRTDCMLFITYYRVEFIIMMIFFIIAYFFFGERTGGTLWLHLGRYMSISVETFLYLFVPVVLLIFNSGRMEKPEMPAFKRTRILYTVLMIVYLGSILWMTLSERSRGIGMFGRASSLIGLYLGLAILSSPVPEAEAEAQN